MSKAKLWNTTIAAAQQGFSLVELLIAAGLGVLMILTAGEVMIQQQRSAAKLDQLQRQREDWRRASSFLEAELSLSTRILSNNSDLSNTIIGRDCDLQPSELRLAIDIQRDAPLILYGVRALSAMSEDDRDEWTQYPSEEQPNRGVLIRCGPSMAITASGDSDYQTNGSISQNTLLDGLDLSEGLGGLEVIQSATNAGEIDVKQVRFALHLRSPGSTHTHSLGSGAMSRINPVYEYPIDDSLCPTICTEETCVDSYVYVIPLTQDMLNENTYSIPEAALEEDDNVLVCSLVDGITIRGSAGHDVLDGMSPNALTNYSGTSLVGGNGNDRLFGTPGSDTLEGGAGNDVLVGRHRFGITSGDDLLSGGAGTNTYLPWPDWESEPQTLGSATIQGGSGQDIVFLPGNSDDFERAGDSSGSSCTISACILTLQDKSTTASLRLEGVEVLVFQNTRLDLQQDDD